MECGGGLDGGRGDGGGRSRQASSGYGISLRSFASARCGFMSVRSGIVRLVRRRVL